VSVLHLRLGEWTALQLSGAPVLLVFPEGRHTVGAWWLAVRAVGPVLLEAPRDGESRPFDERARRGEGDLRRGPFEARIRRGEIALSVEHPQLVEVRLSGVATGFPAGESGNVATPPPPFHRGGLLPEGVTLAELVGGRLRADDTERDVGLAPGAVWTDAPTSPAAPAPEPPPPAPSREGVPEEVDLVPEAPPTPARALDVPTPSPKVKGPAKSSPFNFKK
jgi:hypothetical protein